MAMLCTNTSEDHNPRSRVGAISMGGADGEGDEATSLTAELEVVVVGAEALLPKPGSVAAMAAELGEAANQWAGQGNPLRGKQIHCDDSRNSRPSRRIHCMSLLSGGCTPDVFLFNEMKHKFFCVFLRKKYWKPGTLFISEVHTSHST